MGQVGQKGDKVLSFFFEFPQKRFGLRELSRLCRMPKSSLPRVLQYLIQQKLIQKNKNGYIANETNFWYRFKKRNDLLTKIYQSGLVDFLQKSTFASVIILFGSGAKGEYVKKSDLDIFVQAPEKIFELHCFEKKLRRSINLQFKEKLDHLNPELLNNIVNGYKLSGYLKIK